jgi:hypothetical protein
VSQTPGRSNGLPATRYTPLVDLEPQLADALLEALRDEGVAAYAAPSPGVRGPYGDVHLPDRLTDRVWVDAGARVRAREVLSARMPEFQEALSDEHGHTMSHGPAAPPPAAGRPVGRPATDDDAAWEAIIAGWDLTATEPVPPWPAAEDVEPPGAKVVRPAPTPPPPVQSEPVPFGPRDHSPPEDKVVPEDAEEHYVPPPPPPLPRIDPLTKLAWVGVLGAPLWLILVSAFDWMPAVEGSGVLALFAFIGGFVGLVYRMKDDGNDGDHDDGAVV